MRGAVGLFWERPMGSRGTVVGRRGLLLIRDTFPAARCNQWRWDTGLS